MVRFSIKKVWEGKERHRVTTVIASFLITLFTQVPEVIHAQQVIGLPNSVTLPRISPATGQIVGSVRMAGSFKAPEPLPVFKNKNFCGSSVPDESLLVNVDGGIRNVVVILHGADRNFGQPPSRIVLDNKNCRFTPHVQVAPLGSDVLLQNSDPILHDVHARLNSQTLFNIGLPTWRQVRKRLTKSGIVEIECEVLHTWMSAYIVVTSSPYFAVTDQHGQFSIKEIPPGDYELEVWHERLGRQSRKVEILEGRSSRVDLVFPCPSC